MTLSLLSRRKTILSPVKMGMVEIRISSDILPRVTLVRPSCGRRLSAMLRPPSSLIREAMAGNWFKGQLKISVSTPSTRQRTETASSPGSMWISLAPSSSERVKISLTRRTIRASPAMERRVFSSSAALFSSSSSSPRLWSLLSMRSRNGRRTKRTASSLFHERETRYSRFPSL